MKKNFGITLLEMLMVIVITSVLAAISAPLLIQGFNAYTTSSNTINATWQGQIALEEFVRDVRNIRSPGDITTANTAPPQLTFTDVNGATRAYALSGSTLTLNGNVLADGVNSLAFSFYDATGTITATPANICYIKITLGITQNNSNFSLTTSAYVRNAS